MPAARKEHGRRGIGAAAWQAGAPARTDVAQAQELAAAGLPWGSKTPRRRGPAIATGSLSASGGGLFPVVQKHGFVDSQA